MSINLSIKHGSVPITDISSGTVTLLTGGKYCEDNLSFTLSGVDPWQKDLVPLVRRFAVGSSGTLNTVYYSNDGINWITTTFTPSVSNYFRDASSCVNNKFILIATNGNEIIKSDDGINWTCLSLGGSFDNTSWNEAIYGNNMCVISSGNNVYSGNHLYSRDFENWTSQYVTSSGNCAMPMFFKNKFFVIGVYNFYSSDGINWTRATSSVSLSSYGSIAHNDSLAVCVTRRTSSNTGYYSEDGFSWTSFSLPTTAMWVASYCKDRFIIGSSNGLLMYSYNGIDWITVSANFTTVLAIGYGIDKYILFSNYGDVNYSSDCVTWNTVSRSTYPMTLYGNHMGHIPYMEKYKI